MFLCGEEVCKSLTNSPNRVNCVIWSACVSSTPQFGECDVLRDRDIYYCPRLWANKSSGRAASNQVTHSHNACSRDETRRDHRNCIKVAIKKQFVLAAYLGEKLERCGQLFFGRRLFRSNGNFIVSLKRRELKVNLRRSRLAGERIILLRSRKNCECVMIWTKLTHKNSKEPRISSWFQALIFLRNK